MLFFGIFKLCPTFAAQDGVLPLVDGQKKNNCNQFSVRLATGEFYGLNHGPPMGPTTTCHRSHVRENDTAKPYQTVCLRVCVCV